jgi:AcrR family transcriptional regulator/transcriptional regulator with XRE-family HTH domain
VFGVTEQDQRVGRAVRSAREAAERTLRGTAADLGVSPATLSAVEHGKTPLTVDRLQRLATLLDVPAARLLAGEETPTSSTLAAAGRADEHDWRDFSGIEGDPVLEAATRVFVRRGFHAAAMREVAAEAGLSVAGVYHHYPSKHQILVALLDITMAEIRWRMEAARREGRTPVESFALMVEALALFHAVRGDLAFLGASEMRGLEGEDLVRVTGLRNGVQYALDEQVRLCLATGDFAVEDPHTAGRAIATMCTSLPGWFRPDGPLSAPQVASQYAGFGLALMGAPLARHRARS